MSGGEKRMATLADRGAGAVQLAVEQPFRLGTLHVMPALRQVEVAGASRTLEPRVMQVLVLLAGKGGGIVGRDELVARCWNGRVVGDNAINRVISILRALGTETDAFRIETITKVGYRLSVLDPEPAQVPDPPLAPARRTAVAVLGLAAIGGVGVLGWLAKARSSASVADQHYQRGIDSERRSDTDSITQAIAH